MGKYKELYEELEQVDRDLNRAVHMVDVALSEELMERKFQIEEELALREHMLANVVFPILFTLVLAGLCVALIASA